MPRTTTSLVTVVACLSIGAAVACRGGNSPSTVTPTGVPSAAITTATPMPTPPTEAQVSAAYLAYWDAYAKAVLNLDASLMVGFAKGDELAGIQNEIEQHRRDGVAVRISVQHDFAIVQMTSATATVVDRVSNRSFYVDPQTKQPPSSETPATVLRYTFFLENTGNGWIVVRGQKESPS